MKTTIALALGLLLNFGGSAALADMDHKGHGSSGSAAKKMDHGSMDHGAMSHGDDMHAMHTQMQTLHDHSKMMAGMNDCGQLRAAMKKHMRMMDEMMGTMMGHTMDSGATGKSTP